MKRLNTLNAAQSSGLDPQLVAEARIMALWSRAACGATALYGLKCRSWCFETTKHDYGFQNIFKADLCRLNNLDLSFQILLHHNHAY